MTNPDLSRYARQIIYPGLGEAGQRKLLASTVVIVGCGATGTVIANHLAEPVSAICASSTAILSS